MNSQPTKFIAGIARYCDQWCERCRLSEYCQIYVTERQNGSHDEAQQTRQREKEALWRRLESSLEAQDERLRSHHGQPLILASHDYAVRVDQWFSGGADALRNKEEELLLQARLGVGHVNEELISLTDAVRTLRWYQRLLGVKLMLGLDERNREEQAPDPASPPAGDGTAKVALLAMDNSIAAWLRMKEFFPEKADEILNLLLLLSRLRRETETHFVNARSFVRTGLDDFGF